MRTIRVGVIGFDGVAALDLLGPLEAFSAAATEPRTAFWAAGIDIETPAPARISGATSLT